MITLSKDKGKIMSDITENFDILLLRKLLMDGEFFNRTFSNLKPDYFQGGSRELFKCIHSYYGQYRNKPNTQELLTMVKDINNPTIREQIKETVIKISQAQTIENTQFMLDETLKYIKNVLFLKALEVGAEGLQKKSDALQQKSKSIMDEMSKISFDESIGIDFDDVEDMISYFSDRGIGLLTSLKELNKRLGSGFAPGTLNVICAAQGVGKSLLMCHLATDFLKQGKNILMVSLEMSDKEMMKRIYANVLDIDANTFRDLSKTEGELAQITNRPITTADLIRSRYNQYKMSGSCGKLKIKDYPTGSFSALMLEQLLDKYKVEENLTFDAVFVDYLGIMKSDLVSPSAGLYSYLKSIGEEVRATAKKYMIPLISASQLNRSAINNTEVDNSALSDSVATAMTADAIILVLQNEEMKQKSEVTIKFTKNRYTGMTDTYMMNVDYPHMRFSDMVVGIGGGVDLSKDQQFIKTVTPKVTDDFGFITSDKLKSAEQFAKSEEIRITKEHNEAVKKADEEFKGQAFSDNTDDIFKQLGL